MQACSKFGWNLAASAGRMAARDGGQGAATRCKHALGWNNSRLFAVVVAVRACRRAESA
jgi:hypothetical protein